MSKRILITVIMVFLLLLSLVETTIAVSLSDDEQVIEIADQRQLFIDKMIIESIEDVSLELHEPIERNIVIQADKPWEAKGLTGAYATVIKDGDIYRLYYRTSLSKLRVDEVTCVAESQDGINWTKLDLGIYEWKGSKNNNITFWQDWVAGHNFTPFLDTNPDCPADQRYKALGGTFDVDKGEGCDKRFVRGYVSPDGLHWKRIQEEPLLKPVKRFAYDSQNVAFWSEVEGQYVCYARIWLNPDSKREGVKGNLRWINRFTSNDFINWSEPVDMGVFKDGKPTRKYHLYTNQTMPYFRAPQIYIGLATRFMPDRQVLSEQEAKEIGVNPKYYKDCSDAILLTTRAGTTYYEQTFEESYLRPGIGTSNWVSRTNYPALNIVPTSASELSFYVTKNNAQPTMNITRYSLRTDGFISVNGGFNGGELITKPIKFKGNSLSLNFSTSAAGSIRIEIQNIDGKPIPGFTLRDSRELIGNEIDKVYDWSGRKDLSKLEGKAVRLRFVLKDADLYSFVFSDIAG